VFPSALVTFSSWAGKTEAVPVTCALDASWGTVTESFALIPGVMNWGTGDSGFFVSCVMLMTGLPFASLVPVAAGRPAVAVASFVTFPLASRR
jgi:hypothetical protein